MATGVQSPPTSFGGSGWHWFWGALKQSKKTLLGRSTSSAAHQERHGSPRLYPRDARINDDGGSYWPRGVYGGNSSSNTGGAVASASTSDAGSEISEHTGKAGAVSYHLGVVQAQIQQQRLAPFYDGAPDEPDPAQLQLPPPLHGQHDAAPAHRSELVATIRETVDHLKHFHLGPPHAASTTPSNNKEPPRLDDLVSEAETKEQSHSPLHKPVIDEEDVRPSSRHRRYREGSGAARGLTRSLSSASARLKRRLSQKPSSPLQPQLDVEQATATPTAHHLLTTSSSSAAATSSLMSKPVERFSGWEHPIECPICFLWYPENINYCRCCHQPICTECFVEIKRSENGEPATCPFCVEPYFGVLYRSPAQLVDAKRRASKSLLEPELPPPSPSLVAERIASSLPIDPFKVSKEQRGIPSDDPRVVTSDLIRPDWQLKLKAKEDAEAERQRRIQRLNRRINQLQILPEPRQSSPSSRHRASHRAASPSSASSRSYDVMAAQQVSTMRGADGAFGYLATLSGPEIEELLLAEAMRMSMHDQPPPAVPPSQDEGSPSSPSPPDDPQ